MNPRIEFRRLFRLALFARRGVAPEKAAVLADRLTLRDAELDTRKFCLECRHLQASRTCFAAARGWIPGCTRRMEPIVDVLQRCPHFEWATP